MAFLPAMRWTPIERTAVTTAGSPSGTAATARATPRINTSKIADRPLTFSTSRIVTIIAEHPGDARRFGLHPRSHDDRPSATVRRSGPAEHHVVPIAQGHLS